MSKEMAQWQGELKKSSVPEINNMMLDSSYFRTKKAEVCSWHSISSALPFAFSGAALLAVNDFTGLAIFTGLAAIAAGIFWSSWEDYTSREAITNEAHYHSSEACDNLVNDNVFADGQEYIFIKKPTPLRVLNPLRFFMKTKINEYVVMDSRSGIATRYALYASFFAARFKIRKYLSDRAVFDRTVANLELES